MENCFSLKSEWGNFDLTPDQDCKMVYVEKHRKAVEQLSPVDLPSWCFEPETIWFFFEAPESEDKVSAGEKIKNKFLEEVSRV